MISFFEKIEAEDKHKPGTIAKAFATHPQTPERIEKAQDEINTLLPARAAYTVDTSEFENVKARLAQIENRHKIEDHQEHRPTLRSVEHGGSDNGRPTLKRRPENDFLLPTVREPLTGPIGVGLRSHAPPCFYSLVKS
jgi:hypothetical protein